MNKKNTKKYENRIQENRINLKIICMDKNERAIFNQGKELLESIGALSKESKKAGIAINELSKDLKKFGNTDMYTSFYLISKVLNG